MIRLLSKDNVCKRAEFKHFKMRKPSYKNNSKDLNSSIKNSLELQNKKVSNFRIGFLQKQLTKHRKGILKMHLVKIWIIKVRFHFQHQWQRLKSNGIS